MSEEIKSEVAVFQAGSGYLIEVKDQFTMNRLAVTVDEMKKIDEIISKIIQSL